MSTAPSARPRTTQLFCASTLYGAATLAAALDAGCFTPADRRVLVVLNNTMTPETSTPLDAMPGFALLRTRFDRVVSYNEAIRPFHPGDWAPRADDVPMWERYFRLLWDLGDDRIELAVESIQVNPALAFCQIFHGAPIHVYADGLMSYGPTRNKLDPLTGTRVRRLLHLDLVAGLKPLLLSEFGVEPELIPSDDFVRVLGELSALDDELRLPEGNPALLLGQYLSALRILSAEEEEKLHVQMVKGAYDLGHRAIVFKPHPSAPERQVQLIEAEAERLGVELTVLDSPVLAEVVYERMRPALVVGCFSTALLTAATFYGIPVARVGTERLLDRLAPFQNSNRIPLSIVHALLPDVTDAAGVEAQKTDAAGAELTGLLTAIGFAMQPQIYPQLRPAAEAHLARHLDDATWKYFKRKRLTSLGLPGGLPSRLSSLSRNPAARRVVRQARRLKRAVRR
ncbi:polysialyltransferase family glycosyltransferase [Streptomyces sp. NPDC050418]|uniref:polysialyltransferase family glycosyltransferase n=1 Tax=Streptomyces sp. NPDC050418 TaxID=3365612 RepID=UPI0037913817